MIGLMWRSISSFFPPLPSQAAHRHGAAHHHLLEKLKKKLKKLKKKTKKRKQLNFADDRDAERRCCSDGMID